MNFVIPKKKRVIEKPEIDPSLLEPKATIEELAQDSSKFSSVKNIVMESTSDRQVHHFIHVEKVQLIRNRLLEYKYNQFKANLRSMGQSDVESYEFLLIGFDPEDSQYIADNGYTVGTAFHGDLGLTLRGVYLYRHVDLVTPSLFYKDELMRVMVFRTLRGKCYPVGLGSTELEPTLECSSHVAASDHIPSAKKSRQQLYRQSAVYHYEYNKDMSVAEVPSGVLPYAIVDLRFGLSEKSQYNNVFPSLGYVHDQLHFYPVYEGHLTICSSIFERTTLCTIIEDSNKPHGLDESLTFTKLLKWPDVYDMKGIAQLTTPDVWGLIAKQREVCVKNPNEKSDKWKFRYASHFVWICNEARFATVVNAMRVEQCAAVSYSIDATTYVAFPSSQFSSVFGLPWLQIPALHVLVIHANPLFYADPNDLNSFSDETEITSKIPLGTAILDGDDASLCRFFSSSGHSNGSSYNQPESFSPVGSTYDDTPSQNIEPLTKTTDDLPCVNDDADDEQLVPVPPVPLPSSAGKSCLRSKPPQVFVDNPPLIGKSVPPPAPGTVRNSSTLGAAVTRKARIRWAESVVDNENKCGKKLSNDRDEALKARIYGRDSEDHASENTISSSHDEKVSNFSLSDVKDDSPSVGTKTKDLFQGVFSTIAKGGISDVDVTSTAHEEPITHVVSEPLKSASVPRRSGQSKNCIITSLPLPLMSRNVDGSRDNAGMTAASTTNIQPSEDELTICDMEIESGSDEMLTPPAVKPSPERSDEVIDFIDDHDEDYDAQFKCESSTSWDAEASCLSQPSSISLSKQRESTTTSNTLIKQNDFIVESAKCSAEEIPKNHGSPHSKISSEPSGVTTSSTTTVSEMPENVVRLLELLRSNESAILSRDTDLRKQSAASSTATAASSTATAAVSTATAELNRQRKSRFDQPPPELADHSGFVPKPVPTDSIGFVGHVPALGSSVMDTDLRSHPPHTLAFSIKKAIPAPTLNPAPLVFGDDEDDDVNESDDQQLRSRCDRKDRDDRRDRGERKEREDKKDHDDRTRRWDKSSVKIVSQVTVPTSSLPSVTPQAFGFPKEKHPDSTKLFHILSGARLLQSQRDKQCTDYAPSSISNTSDGPLFGQQNLVPEIPAERASFKSSAAIMSTARDTVGSTYGLSNDVVKQLLKKSTAPLIEPQLKIGQDPQVLLDTPASPDPEGPASPDAPASPDPEENTNGPSDEFKRVAHSKIPLDCWQPTEDIRSVTDKALSARTVRKSKRPKDHDGISCGGKEDLAMNSWIKALEQKSDPAASSKRESCTNVRPNTDDEGEEGEILSDGSDDLDGAPQSITVIGASSDNFHSSFSSMKDHSNSEGAHSTDHSFVDSRVQHVKNTGVNRSYLIDQRWGAAGDRKGFQAPNQMFSPIARQDYGPMQQRMQGCGFQPGSSWRESSALTVIVPDFMMFNRTAMTRMDPAGFESFCDRLKFIQSQENRMVLLHFHERLLQYIREMIQSLADSDTGKAFQMYYSVVMKYRNLGVVHFMERHACDDNDVCAAQTINCFANLRRSHHPSTILIYMSNMSPGSSTGSALSSIGVRVIPPTSVMRSFGLEQPRYSFLS